MPAAASAETYYQRGNALRSAGRFGEAEEALRTALQLAPEHRDASYSLAYMLREAGRVDAAAQVAFGWCTRARPGLDDTLAALGFLLECAALALAFALVSEARARWPTDARLAAMAGEIALALGEFDAAADALRAALDRDPRISAAWLRLAHCRRFSRDDDSDMRRFERGWNEATLPAEPRYCAGFAFAKALDDLGDFARAAEVLRAANARARAHSPWRSADWSNLVQAQLAAAPLPSLAAPADFVPVFVVGLPRSGTTLVATALGRFDGVRDRGELNWIGALHAHLTERGLLRDEKALASAAAMIRAQMRRDDAPARCYVDKNPLNFRYLDFVAALFPDARIVHCRRGLRDTALSLWMQHFAHADLGFAHDFGDIDLVARDHAALMAHWRARGIEMLDLDYETFVSDAAAQSARLAAFIGARNARASEDAAGVVRTASVWQVRQPVHTRSVGRWRNYAPFVPELAALRAD